MDKLTGFVKLQFTQTSKALHTTTSSLLEPLNMILFTVMFSGFIVLLQWLFQPSVFVSIVTNSSLGILDKIDVIVQGFFSVFRLIDDFTPISFILIALFQSAAIVLWLSQRKIAKTNNRKHITSMGLGLFGSGCVACGGSILSPIVFAFISPSYVILAQFFGDAVLTIAIYASFRAWRQIALQYSLATRGN